MSALTWLLGLLTKLEVKIALPIDIFNGSKSALHIAGNLVYRERTYKIEIDYHFTKKEN